MKKGVQNRLKPTDIWKLGWDAEEEWMTPVQIATKLANIKGVRMGKSKNPPTLPDIDLKYLE